MSLAKTSCLMAKLLQPSLPKSLYQFQKLNLTSSLGSSLGTSKRLLHITMEKTKLSASHYCKSKMSRRAITSAAASFPSVKEKESVTICRRCNSDDREDLIDFMSKMFVTREPLMKNLGATPENSKKYIAYCIDEALEQDASFVAIDGESGLICGLRVNAIGPSSGQELSLDFGPKINAIPQFLHHIEKGTAQFLGTERYLRHVAICVKPSSSQCGIATDLTSLSVRCAIERDLSHMTAMCSWKLPYILAKKMGYSLAWELGYEDYAELVTDDVKNGFMTLAKSEDKARVMVKKLQ